jgi:hypothetical protein
MENGEWRLRRASRDADGTRRVTDLFFVVRSLCFVLRAIQLLGGGWGTGWLAPCRFEFDFFTGCCRWVYYARLATRCFLLIAFFLSSFALLAVLGDGFGEE